MSDMASLHIRIQSLEADAANRRLNDLTRNGKSAEKATDGLTSAFLRFAGPAAIVAATIAGMTKLVGVTREFNVLNAQLITATGSADNAARAFIAIQQFAQDTPYDLQQVTEGFTKLVNLGLTPSERAMTSYGNTASAMGKDIIQLIEAAADAATGEFERLKEFGIKSKNQGDTIQFTFRGVKETVKNNAEEIEGYLIKLGETNFAGAMEERMKTLDGAMSNFGDEWDTLFRNVSEQGVGELIEDGVRLGITALQELNAQVASGQLKAEIAAMTEKFDGFGRDVTSTLEILTPLFNEASRQWGDTVRTSTDHMIDGFVNMPENIRALVQLVTTELAYLVDVIPEFGDALDESVGAAMVRLIKKGEVYGEAWARSLNPFDDGSFNVAEELAEVERITDAMIDQAWKGANEKTEANQQARIAVIEGILAERDADVAAFKVRIDAAQGLRKAYDDAQAARKLVTGDRLEEFKAVGGGVDTSETATEKKVREKEEKATAVKLARQQKDFAEMQKSLRTDEEALQESYDRRLAIILANTEAGSTAQADLKKRLDEQFATDALGKFAEPVTIEDELAKMEEDYARRRELILNNTALTQEQQTELEAKLTEARNKRITILENQKLSMMLNAGAQTFDALAGLTKTFAGEQSSIYKVMFAASKAFALADSIMKIQQGIANASALPWPANLGAIASTITATAGVVSTISSVSGAGFKAGGYTGNGGVGDVAGVVHGQEFVFDAAATGRIGRDNLESMRQGRGGSQGANVNLNFVVTNTVPGTDVEVNKTKDANGEDSFEILFKRVNQTLITGMREGGSEFSNAVEQTYALQRNAG